MKLKLWLFLLFVPVMCSCSAVITQEMVTAELTLKQAKINSAIVVATSCQQGLMGENDCFKASQYYQLAQVTGNTALSIMLLNCTDEALKTQIQAAITAGYPQLSFSQIVVIPSKGTSSTTDTVNSTN